MSNRTAYASITVLMLSGVWLGYAFEGGSLVPPVFVSALLVGLMAGVMRLVASKNAEPKRPARPESERERRLRQQAELAGSLAPRGMGPYVNPRKPPDPPRPE